MTKLGELRQQFLDFYQAREHVVIPSASLLPENDATTLFTSSGMQPLIQYFLGTPHPQGKRITDCQKCFRAVDIEEVGDARHTTFFEMLGNWSFGDYFKQKQLGWVFEFFVREVGLDPKRLYVTVFAGDKKLGLPEDKDSVRLWQCLFAAHGIEAKVGERIFKYDAHKNWWSRSGVPAQMPLGEPGGGDSEIFYDFGAELKLHESSPWRDQPCHPNCDCGRFIEIGNSVFMEYQKGKDNHFSPLPQKNVDYGGGLERLLMAVENCSDVFATSLFAPLIKTLEKSARLKYAQASPTRQRACRIIADHLRSSVMLLAEGVKPSNKEQGYVLRRLIRKAQLQAQELKLEGEVLVELVEPVIKTYQRVYPEVKNQALAIKHELSQELKRFAQTLARGLKEIAKLEIVDGEKAFFLYESYGFPWELTKEIVAERGQQLDEASFLAAKTKHQQQSRLGSAAKFKGGLADTQTRTVKFHTATHLLLAALKKILDPEIYQKGANITAERARFDFNYPRPLTVKELEQIQAQVNTWIKADLGVKRQEYPLAQALKLVGGSVFSDRYPRVVDVYQIGTIPPEICAGPHVKRTGEIGEIELKREQSAGAGVRRLYLYLLN